MAFLYYWIGVRNGQNAPLVSTPRPAHSPIEAGEAVNLDPGLQKTLFLDRMPPRVGRELLALQMEDHYVRAHTEHGSALILMSLKEAIAELGDAEGMQVHRSWWVARGAVADKGLERPQSDFTAEKRIAGAGQSPHRGETEGRRLDHGRLNPP